MSAAKMFIAAPLSARLDSLVYSNLLGMARTALEQDNVSEADLILTRVLELTLRTPEAWIGKRKKPAA